MFALRALKNTAWPNECTAVFPVLVTQLTEETESNCKGHLTSPTRLASSSVTYYIYYLLQQSCSPTRLPTSNWAADYPPTIVARSPQKTYKTTQKQTQQKRPRHAIFCGHTSSKKFIDTKAQTACCEHNNGLVSTKNSPPHQSTHSSRERQLTKFYGLFSRPNPYVLALELIHVNAPAGQHERSRHLGRKGTGLQSYVTLNPPRDQEAGDCGLRV
ncbi:hypothetical protein BaRGS_00030578 [Batillaria attramentaria]|uniref:Uncharacterized protein n=1 Tax=Batillaria attramentaria TaxID=370345 RepID=A0ABD0JUB5_9CAEN